jgi:hypothetical protein
MTGGQLDVQGSEENCPTWEKLENVGPSTPRSFPMPEGLSYEVMGDCAESPGHTSNTGKYTVRLT